MFWNVLISILFGHCDEFLFLKYDDGTNFCELYIGDSIDNNYSSMDSFFVSRDVNVLSRIFNENWSFKNIILYLRNSCECCNKVDPKDHDEIRKIALVIKDKVFYNNFINCGVYYKYKFDLSDHKKFFINKTSMVSEEDYLTWEHTEVYHINSQDLYEKIDLKNKKFYDMKTQPLDFLVTNINDLYELTAFINSDMNASILSVIQDPDRKAMNNNLSNYIATKKKAEKEEKLLLSKEQENTDEKEIDLNLLIKDILHSSKRIFRKLITLSRENIVNDNK
ncbi:uncharacterized protein VNE69_09041 [Vairimorpha necatrix]|uniref:Uncharacterized protein n=1 Tax=Vairimorpha necatrix TaxID=6039 RepID=A0AAX4JF41_9MICR